MPVLETVLTVYLQDFRSIVLATVSLSTLLLRDSALYFGVISVQTP